MKEGRGFEVHVRHPQGDDVPVFVLFLLETTRAASIDGSVELEPGRCPSFQIYR